ncbi:hypothetical protein [Coleofasciculus sp. E1-EBD-02]|uniref:hypothetical protein n=1 Tax=Coleofasciculus sp. E1-EBD-02 TaxID=3068481 RepID=UPI0032F13356
MVFELQGFPDFFFIVRARSPFFLPTKVILSQGDPSQLNGQNWTFVQAGRPYRRIKGDVLSILSTLPTTLLKI